MSEISKLDDLDDLDDLEASKLASLITRIMKLAGESASCGSATSHQIYVLARDARDLLVFDAQSRDTMRKLSVPVVQGLEISPAVEEFVRQGQKIQAIKQLRQETGCGLFEAKNAVEAFSESFPSF
jgi:hypothetical protein